MNCTLWNPRQACFYSVQQLYYCSVLTIVAKRHLNKQTIVWTNKHCSICVNNRWTCEFAPLHMSKLFIAFVGTLKTMQYGKVRNENNLERAIVPHMNWFHKIFSLSVLQHWSFELILNTNLSRKIGWEAFSINNS